MNIKTIVRILLGILAIVLAYLIFESIMKPVRFETLKKKKEAEIVVRLKEIRDAEIAFKSKYGHYCATMDSLVLFLETDRLPTVKKTGVIPDSLTEAEALRLKLISRDTVYSDAYSVIFPNREDKAKHLATLRYIPFTNRTKEFHIEAGYITRNNIQVPVVEVSAPLTDYITESQYNQLLGNTIKRLEDLKRFPGMKFGSMDDALTEGNWE